MLTADLVRATVRNGEVSVRTIDAESEAQLARAEALVRIFSEHVGKTRGELDEALSDHIGDATDFAVQKGLAKLLFDRTELRVHTTVDPVALRRRVFELAAQRGPLTQGSDRQLGTPRADVLAEAAAELGCEPEAAEQALYADLQGSQRIESFEALEPRELLDRYNTALAQGVLLRAHELTVWIKGASAKRVRALFRSIKFHGLIHRAFGSEKEGYTIKLDGPLSLFRLSSRYGLQMATFLPSLLRAEGWRLEATIAWPGVARRARYRLSEADGLRATGPDRGVWVTDEERMFMSALERSARPWTASPAARLLRLEEGEVIVPDLVLRHEDGREAMLEILGFWRRGSLQPRLDALARAPALPLVLAVSDRLNAGEEELGKVRVPVVRFKGVIPVKKVLELAEKVAQRGLEGA